MRGCFKNLFAAVGCLTLLLIAIVLTWLFWPQLKAAYEERFASHARVQVVERVV